MRVALLVVVPAILFCGPRLAADQITLTNGDRLTGTIVALENERLQMRSELAGTISVPWSAVATVATERPLAVTLADHQVILGALATRDGQILVRGEAGDVPVARESVRALRLPEAQASFEARRRAGVLALWQGSADTGLSSTRGNSETLTLTLGLKASRPTETDKLSTYLNYLLGRDRSQGETQTTANTVRGGARYEYNLRQRLFTFGFTDLEFDELQQLDLRLVLGGGLGWRVRQTRRTRLELFAGGSFNREDFQDQPLRRSAETLLGEELAFQLTARTALRERLSVFPNLSDLGEYRITLDSSLETRLNSWLSWQVTVADRYLSNPPPATQKNDLLLTTGLRITFGTPAR